MDRAFVLSKSATAEGLLNISEGGYQVILEFRKITIFGLLCFLGLGAVFTGCSQGDREKGNSQEAEISGIGEPVSGGLVVIAWPGDPDVLNPLIRRSANAGRILAEIHATLTEMGEDLEPYPLIASSWNLAADSLSITYNLKPWVWEDGEPLGPADVAASFRLFKNPVVASPNAGFFRDVKSIEVLSDHALKYTFSKVLSDPVFRTTHAILPLHRMANLDPAQVDRWVLNQQPVASGPFRLVSWEHNKEIVLEPNPNYPLAQPYLSRVSFRILKESSARVIGLENGEIDFVAGVSPQEAKRIQKRSDLQVFRTSGRKFYFLQWNCRNPIFLDTETRRALSLAIDRPRMIQTLLEGYGVPAVGPIAQVVWNFDRDLTPDPFDPAAAAQLLADAGWVDQDGDGFLERNGISLDFEILTRQGDPVRTEGLTILRENFNAVGAAVRVRILELASGLELLRKGQFDSYFGAMNPNLFGDPSSIVHSEAIDEYNYGFYSNTEVDSLLSLALGQSNRELAHRTWNKIQALLQVDQPAAYLMCPQRLDVAAKRLNNVRPHVLSSINNLSEWWVASADRKYLTGQ